CHTRSVIYLEDGEFALMKPDSLTVYDPAGREISKKASHVDWSVEAAEKGGYEHFMLKEIMEQPNALRAAIEPRLKGDGVFFDGLDLSGEWLREMTGVVITACGSAYHAGCVGRDLIESLCRIPVRVEVASELRYNDPMVDEHTLAIILSQSGETADTIAALNECKRLGAKTVGIVNVVDSTIAKSADSVLYTWAGPEIAVATTKGYTTQVAVLTILAVYMADKLGRIDENRRAELVRGIASLPERCQRAIDMNGRIERLARKYKDNASLFFIGRNLDYAVCLEASLKLKEISYIHSEAYAAGELKHGTIALIEEGRLVIALACRKELYEKTAGNIREVKARGARVLGVAVEGDRRMLTEADDVIFVPRADPLLMPIPETVPLQLFAYYVAKANGCDVDKPKNLAKSVTVE
ncbi:MAG: glutamine--fructose-6-phosphate transaminase (isomerizing), partial [Clostridia bacterium]|nr:glutamine--fructose-6-phosphate transaminase (isomerizing) [Clostridia bacterium]